MLKKTSVIWAILFLLLTFPALAQETDDDDAATVNEGGLPEFMHYTGVLYDMDGELIDDASYPMSFMLYGAPEGDMPIWEEQFDTVAVKNGLFHVTLDSSDGYADAGFLYDMFRDGLWLEVIVDGDTLSPRERVSSVPFAFVSDNSVGDITPRSITIGGM